MEPSDTNPNYAGYPLTPDERAQELYEFLDSINFDGDCKRYGDELVFVLRGAGHVLDIRWQNGWILSGIAAYPMDLGTDRLHISQRIIDTLGGR